MDEFLKMVRKDLVEQGVDQNLFTYIDDRINQIVSDKLSQCMGDLLEQLREEK